jgi:exoribonuclease R
MNEIAQKRRIRRLESGSVLLHNTEFIFKLDPDSRLPQDFTESSRIESKSLVEEYMLLANILVAQFIKPFCGPKTLLRAHSDIQDENKQELYEFFEKIGMAGVINLTNSTTLSNSM